MGRRRLAGLIAACQMATAAAAIATEANFQLGLVAQYSDSQQTIGERTTTHNTLSAGIRLAMDGFVIDPRFLAYTASVSGLRSDVKDSSDNPYERKTTSYGGTLDLFRSRMITVGGSLSHSTSDTTGSAPLSAVGGDFDRRSVYARLTNRRIGVLRLSRMEQLFDADEVSSVRDEDRSVNRMEYQAPVGKNGRTLSLDLWRESADLGQLSQYLADRGLLSLSANPSPRSNWRTKAHYNRRQIGTFGDDLGPPSTSILLTNNYWWAYSNGGRVGASADFQQTDSLEQTTRSALFGGIFNRPVRRTLDVNASASLLLNESDLGLSLDQYSLSCGVGWKKRAGIWFLGVSPTLTYSRTTIVLDDEGETAPQTRLGGSFGFSAQRELWGGNFSANAFYSDNQVSLVPAASDAPGGTTSFLGGVETARQNVLVTYDRRLSSSLSADLRAEATHRTRQDFGARAEDYSALLNLSATWRTLSLGLGYSQIDSDTKATTEDSPVTDLRFEAGNLSATLTWNPVSWLTFLGNLSEYRRNILGVRGTFTNSHAVLLANYAQLTFFARMSWVQFDGTDILSRTDRRFAVGVERSFNFGIR